MSHGSKYHRGPGTMGAVDPARKYLKEKNWLVAWVAETVTIQNLQVVKVDVEKNIILIKGNIPGAKNHLSLLRVPLKGG